MALFITVRKVARSRDFYSRVLGGTVILYENPCTVRLYSRGNTRGRAAHSVREATQSLRNPGAPAPTGRETVTCDPKLCP